MQRLVVYFVALALVLPILPPAGPPSLAEGDIERRIAEFWKRIDALGPTELLSATDLGLWGSNVIDRDPSARISVVDFRASTAQMQAAIESAGRVVPPAPPNAAVERRIADFWQRIDAMFANDRLAAADLGQWAVNVTDRDAGARIMVADFRTVTAGMQAAIDRATAPSVVRPALRADFPLHFLGAYADNVPPGTVGYRFAVGTDVPREGANALRSRLPEKCRVQPPLDCNWQIAFGRSPLVAELFVPRDFPAGEYVFGFTLQDGRSADALFWIPAVLPSAPPAPTAPQTCLDTGKSVRRIPVGSLNITVDFAGPCTVRHQATDASIAVGRTEVLVATNDAFALYDKSGRRIDEISSLEMFASLVRPEGYGWGDPRVLFDREADRYFLAFTMRKASGAAPCGCDLRWLMAVSRSSAPRTLRASDWHLYSLDGTMENGRPSTTGDGDFLVIATDARNVVLHAMVAASPSADEQSTKIWVFDKLKLVGGAPVEGPDREFLSVRDPLTGRGLLRLLPAMMADDPGGVFLVGRSADTRSCSLVVGAVTGPARTAELALRHVAVPGTCPWPPHSVQRGGGTPLVSFGDVTAQPAYGQGRMWLTHAVADRRDAIGARGAVRVVELDVSRWPDTPRVLSDARFGAPDRWFSYPAVIANERGDVALTMTGSGFNDYASVWVTGRLAGDPPGTFRPAVRAKGGLANLNQVFRTSQRNGDSMNKFADFSGAALDPSDGSAWLIGSYVANVCSSGTWITRVDWSIATTDAGADPAPAGALSGPVCQVLAKPFFTLLFDGEVAAHDAPSGTRAFRFTYMNADLADPAVGLRLESMDVGWRVVPPALIVFVPSDRIPGSYHLRVSLADGRATGAFFTIVPP